MLKMLNTMWDILMGSADFLDKNNVKVIALAGNKGSGKNTVADMLEGALNKALHGDHGYKFEYIAYANPIKRVVQDIFFLDTSCDLEYDQFKRTDLSYTLPNWISQRQSNKVAARHVVREIGMLMRSYDEQQFVRYVEDNIKCSDNTVWFVTDLRFDNELQSLVELGATIVQVERPGHESDGHITEEGIDRHSVDHIVRNDGDLRSLGLKVQSLAEEIVKEW